ncbi:OsmC family protein [Protaetiibacter mangrovi]|uniref:OsmC family protein n=1 Tax=Protaetiibacter mangrovi TaxID=2970926 RepID=A0ABT1ZFF3_9MICO|nr:OsmC family protein [Protaetiibacter mangrovi]MCS0499414.1 OsmC family protein [Protaetiibacter mangrovi]TPW91441.1 OsmC family peroxiredoxin [Schumannella luteola]
MDHRHNYAVSVEWTGNRGTGTSGYREYGRELVVRAEGKLHEIAGSSDRAFRGDPARWNPEDLLLTALSQCHLLSYLHVAVTRGIVVVAYTDDATGRMVQTPDGGGHFTEVTLHPVVTIAAGDPADALDAHREASKLCFIASSVNFLVHHEPVIRLADDPLS